MNQPGVLLSRNAFYMLMGAATLVYLIGLFIPIMEVDAAQYAAISREMMENHHYLEVLNRGQNYLDKPPLLFWLCAISFKIFGVNVVAYKLPSYLFTLLGVYSVYRLAKHLYDEQTGLVAALILYTCQAFFLFNNDVRTDTLLTANVIFATWQLVRFVDTGKWKFLIAGFAGVGLAMLASMGLLSLAVRELPIGTAYAVWTGIGTLGAAVFGMAVLGEPAGALRLCSIGLIAAGIAGLKLLPG